ncbi:MAG: hypothetical protein IJW64_02575 [Clostridia bacterium]|nr:hypothetical protein [Clostridia bacterium]
MIFDIIYNLKAFSDEFAKQSGFELSPNGYLTMFVLYFLMQLALHAVYYVFISIGLYTMAKRKGIENPKRALIPFYGIYVVHKLAPDSKYVKKTDAFYILAIIFAGISTATSLAVDVIYGIPNLINIVKGVVPTDATLGLNSYLLAVLDTVNYLTSLAFVIFYLFVLKNMFMSYTLKNNFMFTAFSAVGYVLTSSLVVAGIFIFALRNKPRIDYDKYVESRRRYYNPYGPNNNPYNNGNNPYGNGNPYNNGNNPYGNGGNQNQSTPDPFEEFSDKGGNSKSSDGDDFFN